MNKQRIIQGFVDRGLKEEDVSRSVRETLSYFEKIGLMYRYLHKKGPTQSTGGMNPEIMIVSDSPEESERIAGHSGFAEYPIYLMIFLQRLGININEIFWTQVVKDAQEKVNMTTIKHWYPHLLNEIIITQPTAIIALGTTAITAFAQEPIKIQKAIGGDFSFEMPDGKKDIPVIPIKHPRLVLEENNIKQDTKETWQSLKVIGDLL